MSAAAALLVAIVAILLALCWFLHVITWPLTRLVRIGKLYGALNIVSALSGGAAGGAIGAAVGAELGGVVGAVVLALPVAYAMFLQVFWVSLARGPTIVPGALGTRPRAGFWVGWLGMVGGITRLPARTRSVALIVLMCASLPIVGVGVWLGYPDRGVLGAALLWVVVSGLIGRAQTVRAYIAREYARDNAGQHLPQRCPDARDGLRAKVRRAMWGL